jgi:hypothetical protein
MPGARTWSEIERSPPHSADALHAQICTEVEPADPGWRLIPKGFLGLEDRSQLIPTRVANEAHATILPLRDGS